MSNRNNLLIAAFGFTFAAPLCAQTNTPVIDQRQANQERRIQQGVSTGQLTNREATTLQNRQNTIAADEAAAKADGKVTQRERAQLTREQNRANRQIARKKHNAQTAP